MPERGVGTVGQGRARNSARNHALGASAAARPGQIGPSAGRSARTRQIGGTLAGLPGHVMDELVEDMAEAVVAMLLSQAADEPDEEDDASSDLREV
jgi:hypothetical protein